MIETIIFDIFVCLVIVPENKDSSHELLTANFHQNEFFLVDVNGCYGGCKFIFDVMRGKSNHNLFVFPIELVQIQLMRSIILRVGDFLP